MNVLNDRQQPNISADGCFNTFIDDSAFVQITAVAPGAATAASAVLANNDVSESVHVIFSSAAALVAATTGIQLGPGESLLIANKALLNNCYVRSTGGIPLSNPISVQFFTAG